MAFFTLSYETSLVVSHRPNSGVFLDYSNILIFVKVKIDFPCLYLVLLPFDNLKNLNCSVISINRRVYAIRISSPLLLGRPLGLQ